MEWSSEVLEHSHLNAFVISELQVSNLPYQRVIEIARWLVDYTAPQSLKRWKKTEVHLYETVYTKKMSVFNKGLPQREIFLIGFQVPRSNASQKFLLN